MLTLAQLFVVVPLIASFILALAMLAFMLPETPNVQRRRVLNQKFRIEQEGPR